MLLLNKRFLYILNCFSILFIAHADAVLDADRLAFAQENIFENSKNNHYPQERCYGNERDQLSSIVVIDKNGEIFKVRTFEYDEEGKLIRHTLYGNLTGKNAIVPEIDENGFPIENGVEKYAIEYFFSLNRPQVLLKTVEDNGVTTHFFYDEHLELVLTEKTREGEEQPFEQQTSNWSFQMKPEAYRGEYELLNDRIKWIDGIGEVEIDYNARGQPIEMTYPGGIQECFEYNLDGSLAHQYIKDTSPIILSESSTQKPTSGTPPASSEVIEESEESWSVFGSIKSVCASFFNFFHYMRHKEKDLFKVEKEMEEWIVANFGKTMLSFNGFYQDTSAIGIYGNGEVNDKVRLTAINGILITREDCLQNLNMLSETHGGVNIHYVFHPTEGWTWDVVRATLSKIGYSPQAKVLADCWKDMIKEMGGVNGGGLIIHYAHSLGGTNTLHARDYMTEEELKMIRVITVGSASMIPDGGFESVVNYASKRDGVTKLNFNHIKARLGYMDNVKFVGSHWGFPIIDHLITMDTYKQILEGLGSDFVKKYGSVPRDNAD